MVDYIHHAVGTDDCYSKSTCASVHTLCVFVSSLQSLIMEAFVLPHCMCPANFEEQIFHISRIRLQLQNLWHAVGKIWCTLGYIVRKIYYSHLMLLLLDG